MKDETKLNSLDNGFWERAAPRPKKEGIIELARELDAYILDTLGERIDDVQERGKAEGIAYISDGCEILLLAIGLRFLRIYVHPPAGAAFAPDETFAVERFNLWESAFRKTTGKYVGMTVWVSDQEHMRAMKGIVDRVAGVRKVTVTDSRCFVPFIDWFYLLYSRFWFRREG